MADAAVRQHRRDRDKESQRFLPRFGVARASNDQKRGGIVAFYRRLKPDAVETRA